MLKPTQTIGQIDRFVDQQISSCLTSSLIIISWIRKKIIINHLNTEIKNKKLGGQRYEKGSHVTPHQSKKNSQNRPNPMQPKLRLFGLVLQSSPLCKGLRINTIFSLTLLQIAEKTLGLPFIKKHVVLSQKKKKMVSYKW